jgi:heat shock protein HslJ
MNAERSTTAVGALLLAAALGAGPSSSPAAGDTREVNPPRRTADASVVRMLEAHRWTLQAALDSASRPIDVLLPPGHPFVMSFDGPQVSIQGGCNLHSGAWRLTPQRELLIGRLAATMKACEAALMEADTALSAAFGQPLRVDVTPGAAPSLSLTTATRQTLTFSGEPTLRSLYGAPKRIFLEVAPRKIECTLPTGAAGECLQVRDIQFDAQGLRKGSPGTWRPFAETIEGYAHAAGVRNVLRIDRYERRPAPAGAAAVRYVLDLVVESETVAGK